MTMLTMKWLVSGGSLLFLMATIVWRLVLAVRYPASRHLEKPPKQAAYAYSQTTGNRELQSDCVQVCQNRAGILAVLADGIGKENTGRIAAQIATDAVLDAFEPYQELHNPDYFFRTAFMEAHSRVQQTIGERRGGASVGAVFIAHAQLYYGLAGNIRIALLRNGELIPISKGQTINVLAEQAYREGILTRAETIWSRADTRVWNYLGKDGFCEIEVCMPHISLRRGDLILMASQGIYEVLSWVEIEEILLTDVTISEKADCLVMEAEQQRDPEKENGSVLLLAAEGFNETS